MSGRIFFIPVLITLVYSSQFYLSIEGKKRVESATLSSINDSIEDPFNYLQSCMNGTFDSELQSQQDSDFFHINLRMLPIWSEYSSDQHFYLYVEQAVATTLDKPYRQRIYKVEKLDDNNFVSHIYTMTEPERLIGKDGSAKIFKEISPDSLTRKDGCEVYLKFDRTKQTFNGATGEKTCASDLRGASYASSKVTIEKDMMISWDQGFDKDGKQVWGAVKGGYIFRKKN